MAPAAAEILPASQSEHAAAPKALYLPRTQLVQCVDAADDTFPAAHTLHPMESFLPL